MKVLMATHYFASHAGGIEAVAQQLFDALAGPQCEMLWVAADVTGPPPEAPFRRTLPLKVWNGVERALGVPFPVPTPGALRALAAAVRESDVVLLHDCLYLSNMAAFLLARERGVPVVIVQHIGMVPYGNLALAAIMKLANAVVTRPMLAAAQQAVFISQVTRSYFGSVRFRREPAVIFSGVDSSTFHPLSPSDTKLAIRERLRLPSESPVALFVGRFVEKKGLRVLREMASWAPTITWAFAGSGPLDPAAWRFGNVRVFSELRGKGLAELYRASDVLVLPSTGEGFPLVIQEALACGLPVVCGAETATADEALAPFVHGVLLRSGDDRRSADDFLRVLSAVLAQPDTADARQRRYQFVQARYSWRRAAQQYLELLTLAAGRQRAAAPSAITCRNVNS